MRYNTVPRLQTLTGPAWVALWWPVWARNLRDTLPRIFPFPLGERGREGLEEGLEEGLDCPLQAWPATASG